LPDQSDPDSAATTRADPLLASVVVPTRDRPAALRACLDALAGQTIADGLEVIVVDDASRAADEVADAVGRHPRASLLRREGEGPAAARNAGARAARANLLCFTDDDCLPRAEWAQHLVEALQQGADAVAGTTLSEDGALAEASEIVAHAPAAAPPPRGSDLAFAPSNNLACTRAAFDATPFDESYPHAAGEDRDWCARLIASGYVLRHEPAACLVHRQELTVGRFLRQQVRYGQGAFRFRRRSGETRHFEPVVFYGSLLRRAFRHGYGVGLLVCVAQAATTAGFVSAWASRSRANAEVRRASGGDGS
jgi:glycosyltransferase involved in cell wall biosynthesis